MGYDLTSDSGAETRFNGAGWALLLSVAEEYGWIPAGTLAPEDDDSDPWSGDYDQNAGQRVRAEDAAAMGAALAAAMADPDRRQRQARITRELDRLMHQMEVEAFGEKEIGPYVEADDPLVIPDETLSAFIAFLKTGSFRIE